ncbi:MAG: PLP-dependent aspartate aminotransferase family protein [Planctomycetota bacterium]|nr:PLP-dependent aspartate aminotransferase family protein [Planctomycetota bacterium]
MTTLVANDIATLAIHAGHEPDPFTGALLTPIYQTTTYRQEAVGVDRGYTYSRAGNPTVAALEKRLGALENAPPAVCFSTGMAATTALFFALLQSGDHVVVSDVVYGGTVRLLNQILSKYGVTADFVDGADPRNIQEAIRPNTKLVFIETPANPTLKLTDIEAVSVICREAGIPLVVDNTFLTAALQQPFELGAGISLYSTTKFIEGHNSTLGGAIVTRDESLLEQLRFVRKTLGAPQSPLEAWLTLRGLTTLPWRMKLHSEHALRIARWLETHPSVEAVHYPDLESFPQRELAQKQQQNGGGVLAFEVVGGIKSGVQVMNSLKLCSLAENLGAVETLVTHPVSMTHGDVPPEQRAETGITDGLIRLSVGLESPDDIIADLAQALNAFQGGAS